MSGGRIQALKLLGVVATNILSLLPVYVAACSTWSPRFVLRLSHLTVKNFGYVREVLFSYPQKKLCPIHLIGYFPAATPLFLCQLSGQILSSCHVIVKQITKFDGRRANEFLEWDSKLRASLSVYNITISNVLERPGATVRTRCRPGDHLCDLGCRKYRKPRPIQRDLFHHSWFSVLCGSEVPGQNTG